MVLCSRSRHSSGYSAPFSACLAPSTPSAVRASPTRRRFLPASARPYFLLLPVSFSYRLVSSASLSHLSSSFVTAHRVLLLYRSRQDNDPGATRTYALRGFCVRRTPRACHGACDRLRPGRLRASHAVCLASRTLAPVVCARKEGTDIESVSTTGSILAESLVMRADSFDNQAVSFGFYSTSRHCIPRRSPRNSNSEETANNGAAANRSGCHGSCYFTLGSLSFGPPSLVARMPFLRATLAATAPASAVAELVSLAVARATRKA